MLVILLLIFIFLAKVIYMTGSNIYIYANRNILHMLIWTSSDAMYKFNTLHRVMRYFSEKNVKCYLTFPKFIIVRSFYIRYSFLKTTFIFQ